MSRVVWLGAAGTMGAHGIARRIRANWGDSVGIVAADINPPALVATAALANACEQVPLVADREAFAAALRDGLRRHRADTYVPLLAEEVVAACELRDAGALDGVEVLAPGARSARLCADKHALAARLTAEGLATPPTVLARDAHWWPEGVVVKARSGDGSRGVEILEDPAGLDRARERGDGAVAQRRCRGPEVTVDAFRSRDGAVWSAICRERIEVRAGVCTKARLHRDPALEALVRRVADALGLTGALCVQGMRGPGGWEITDVNPRYGGASAMSAAAGVDTAAAALADRWGEDPRPFLTEFSGEAWVVRSYEESLRR